MEELKNMLIENYYTILSSEKQEDKTLFHVALNKECKVYEGHFPNEPVSPGVCNIQMIRELAEQVVGLSLRINTISQCRLTTLITPITHAEIDVLIGIEEQENGYKLNAIISKADDQCLTLKAEVSATKS